MTKRIQIKIKLNPKVNPNKDCMKKSRKVKIYNFYVMNQLIHIATPPLNK